MALSIKNAETERLARLVAKEAQESLTEAVQQSLQERLQRLQARHPRSSTMEKLKDILARVDALPTLDRRNEEEILGYDEQGIPRTW